MTPGNTAKRVIILGGHVTGLGIARALRKYPVTIEVWDSSSRCLCRKSNLVSRFRKVEIHSTETVLDLLPGASRDSDSELHVVPTDDLSTAIISRNKSQLQDCGIECWVDAWEKVHVFYDKQQTYELASRVDVPHPRTMPAESVTTIEQHIEYPVVLKPNAMEAFNRIHRCKGTICRSRSALEKGLARYAPRDSSYVLLAQEYIPGSGQDQYSLALCRGGDGSLRGLAARRKRQYPAGVGTATYVETTDPAAMIEPSRRLLEEVGYIGVCEVEFKLDSRNGILQLFEVNPRFFKWNSLLAEARVDFVQPFLEPARFQDETRIPWDGHSTGWQDFFADCAAVLSSPGQLSGIGDLFRDLRKKRSDAVLSAGDWGPLFQYLRSLHRFARGGRAALTDR